MKAYKLTDRHGQTKNNTQWGENITHRAPSTTYKHDLCTDHWIHFYRHPLIAVIMNSSHAAFEEGYKMWECETFGKELHDHFKSGCKSLTTIKEIPVPKVNLVQRQVFSVLCAEQVFNFPVWTSYADQWLRNKDIYVAHAMYMSIDDMEAQHKAYDAKLSARSAAKACLSQFVAEIDYYVCAAADYASRYDIPANIDFGKLAEEAMKH